MVNIRMGIDRSENERFHEVRPSLDWKAPHANRRLKKINMGTTMPGAITIGNSKIKTNPGSFIQ